MRGKYLFLLLFIICFNRIVFAQSDIQTIIRNITEQQINNFSSEDERTEFIELLTYCSEHKLNLNKVTREELNALGILNQIQIDELLQYRLQTGTFISIYELQSLNYFEPMDISTLISFVNVDEALDKKITAKRVLNDGDSEWIVRATHTLQRSEGYESKKYIGSPIGLYTRIKYKLSDRLGFCFAAEKDPGESFQKDGFDHYSGYLFYTNSRRTQEWVLGNYQVQLGQGLALWNGQGWGKSADIVSTYKAGKTVKPYASASESGYMQGIAHTLNKSSVSLTTFLSYQKTNKNANGLHRTLTELAGKRQNVLQNQGLYIKLNQPRFHLGTSFFQTYFQNVFLGNTFSFDHAFTLKNIFFFGEIANFTSSFAFIQGVTLMLHPRLLVSILYRNYAPSYQNRFSNGFGESSDNTNEKGIFYGYKWLLSMKAIYSGYVDMFYFNKARFQADAPSKGYDILQQMQYSFSRGIKISLLYRHLVKEKNNLAETNPVNSLTSITKEQIRAHIEYKINKEFVFETRIEYGMNKVLSSYHTGLLLFYDLNYTPLNSKVQFNIRFAIFDSGFGNTFYAYENDILYSFSTSVLQGEGSRTYLNLKYKLNRHIDLYAKYSLSTYFNKETIGSGTDEISGNKRSDLKFQLRYKF